MLNIIRNLLGLLSDRAREKSKCVRCGYQVKGKHNLIICGQHSKEKILSITPGQKRRWMKRLQEDPTHCPLCGTKLKLRPSKRIGYICPRCNTVNL